MRAYKIRAHEAPKSRSLFLLHHILSLVPTLSDISLSLSQQTPFYPPSARSPTSDMFVPEALDARSAQVGPQACRPFSIHSNVCVGDMISIIGTSRISLPSIRHLRGRSPIHSLQCRRCWVLLLEHPCDPQDAPSIPFRRGQR